MNDKNITGSPLIGAEDVRVLRERYHLSQDKFASMLGISVGTLRNWEQGRRAPEGPARVLLNLVERNPNIVWISDNEQ